MMLRVDKCCCCFGLKFGFYTFGVISLIFRVALITFFWGTAVAISSFQFSSMDPNGHVVSASVPTPVFFLAPGVGYTLATTVALYIALRGIATDKSVLVYPYVVVLVLEFIVAFIFNLVVSITLTPWFLLNLVILGSIEAYIFICLWSLYKEMEQREMGHSTLSPMSFTNEQALV